MGAQYLGDKYRTDDGNLDNRVKFSDLHTAIAFPWHELICALPGLTNEDYVKKLNFPIHPTVLEPRKQKVIEGKWLPIKTDFTLVDPKDLNARSSNDIFSNKEDELGLSDEKEDTAENVNPKYLLVVDSSNIRMV